MKREEKKPNDYYRNKLKPPKAFYEWCYRQMRSYVWENKQDKIVASHRKHENVIQKRLTKNSKLNFYDQSEYFEIVLCTKKKIERQVYDVISYFENGIQKYEVLLANLHVFSNNECITIHRDREGQYLWGKKSLSKGMCFYYYPNVYENNWKDKLSKVSELKYLDLEQLEIELLSRFYKYRDRLEYVQKIKAKGLEREFHRQSLDMRKFTMKWLKKWKPFFRKSDWMIKELELKFEFERRRLKYVMGIGNFLTIDEIENNKFSVSLVTMQNYLIKQQKPYHYYKDYLSLLKELKIPVTYKNEFPKELEVAHNKAVDLLNEIKLSVENKAFEKRFKELEKYEMVIDGFRFVIPKKAQELIEEGKNLKHCVGGSNYIKSHADGKSFIIFVRKEQEIDKAYYTLELTNNEIRQLHGFEHARASDKLQKAVDKWLMIITKKDRKEKKVA